MGAYHCYMVKALVRFQLGLQTLEYSSAVEQRPDTTKVDGSIPSIPTMYNLFLDDIRTETYAEFFNYRDFEWTIVKDHTAFIDCIEANGVPAIISFDHDLAEEHYDHGHINYLKYRYKTGLASAE